MIIYNRNAGATKSAIGWLVRLNPRQKKKKYRCLLNLLSLKRKAAKIIRVIKKLFNVSNSNLTERDQKVNMKANKRALVKLIISFLVSLFTARNKTKIVRAPNIAEIRFSL